MEAREEREGDGLRTLLRWIGRIFLALAFSFLLGIVIGTVLRAKLEQPVYYIGSALFAVPGRRPLPHYVAYPGASVLDPGDHEQQIG